MIGGHREVYVVNVAQIGCALEKIEDVRFNAHSIGDISQHDRNTRWFLLFFTVGQILLVDLEFGITWGDLYTESGQTLQGSFSAVSKPIFENKY